MKKKFIIIFFSLVTVSFSIWGAYKILNYFFSTGIQENIFKKKVFGILSIIILDEEKKKIFLNVTIVSSKWERLGIVTFPANTKFVSTSKSLLELFYDTRGNTKSKIKNIQKTLSKLLAIPIPYYILTHQKHLIKTIDLLEGVPFFYFPSAFEEDLKKNSIPKGSFYLDGFLAKNYLSVGKHLYDDIILSNRYYTLFFSFWKHRKNKWNLFKNKDLLNIIMEGTESNIKMLDIIYLLQILSKPQWHVFRYDLPVARSNNYFHFNPDAFFLKYKIFKNTVCTLDRKNLLNSIQPKIELQNGTNVNNLANKIRRKLVRKNFQILSFTNASHNHYDKSILLNKSGNTFVLEVMQSFLKPSHIFYAIDQTSVTDMLLILGNDYSTIYTDQK